MVTSFRRDALRARTRSIDTRSMLSFFGTGRHSALPALRRLAPSEPMAISNRLIALATGSTLIGVAVALLVQADLGLTPYDALSIAIGQRLGLSLGQAGWALAVVLFLTAIVLGRRPSRWGIGYVFANGIAIDAASHILNPATTPVGRIAFVCGSIIVMASGISLVVHSGTTGGPFELLMLAGEDRGLNRTKTRSFLDASVLILGIALGGPFGVATIVYAVTMGLVLRETRQALADHRAGRAARVHQQEVSTDLSATKS